MKRTVEVSAPGVTLADAFDQALGGWFTQPDPPKEALEEARKRGHKVYKFKLTLELMGEVEEPCSKCQGCGQVADSEDQEPWSVWLELPLGSSAAVLAGIVKPIPCPKCKGRKEGTT